MSCTACLLKAEASIIQQVQSLIVGYKPLCLVVFLLYNILPLHLPELVETSSTKI